MDQSTPVQPISESRSDLSEREEQRRRTKFVVSNIGQVRRALPHLSPLYIVYTELFYLELSLHQQVHLLGA